MNLKSDIFDFTRHIQMQKIFYGQDYQDESLVSNKSNKQFKSQDLELQHLVKSVENIEQNTSHSIPAYQKMNKKLYKN